MALPTRVSRNLDFPFESLRDLDTLVNRFWGGRENASALQYAPYAVDVREDADHIYVEAELPGFTKPEVDVTLENSTLTISAERRSEEKRGEKNGDFLLNERRYTRFLRSFTLPPTVNEQNVQAKLTDGVLTVTLKKREETKPRKISLG